MSLDIFLSLTGFDVFEGIGGTITIHHDSWTIEDHCLTATQYRYDLEYAAK
jgi:hypothetical protein